MSQTPLSSSQGSMVMLALSPVQLIRREPNI
jgi:hypothetical protein